MGHTEKQEMRVVVGEEAEGEEERLMVLDFDMLCSAVAQGKWRKLGDEEEGRERDDIECGGGVVRMWEGDLLDDCFDDRRIALQSAFCPCYRFGKNMRRAGFGYCVIQGTIYLILAVTALLNVVAFVLTKRHCFLYLSVAFTISVGTYLGFYRTKIRRKFNVRGSDSSLDDCVYHLICPYCALCQESRTLEMNNVQDGTWHGRGDTICIGGYGEGSKAFFELSPPPIMSTKSPESTNAGGHSWTSEAGQSAPLVPSSK